MERIPEWYAMAGIERGGPETPELSEVERLANEFEAHEMQEKKFLRQYKELAGNTQNPLIRFLVQLIISDEEKHHAVTHAMVSTLKGDLNWTKPDDALCGLYSMVEEKEREKIVKLTEDFIRVEKDGIREYRQLMKESRGYYHDLFVLLFQSMVYDSEKHVKILEFLRQRLKEV